MRSYLITGAGSGIGSAIAQKIALEGNHCILLGRNQSNLEKVRESLAGSNHTILSADITNQNELIKIAGSVKSIEGIIANAGVGGENKWGKNDRWGEILNVNLNGTYNTINSFLGALKNSGEPYKHIIITSSVLARLGVSNYSAYCTSKAGLLGLMRSAAVEHADNKILVNAICPGWVNTEMSRSGMQGIADSLNISIEEFYHVAMKSVPLGKMSEPDEVADLVWYLLNQHSITGQAIDINNGAIMNS